MGYLTKEQVVANFKVNLVPHLKNEPESAKALAWDLLLAELNKDKKITDYQRKTWKCPKV